MTSIEEAYIVIIKGRPNFPNTMTKEEKKIMSEHFLYLKMLMSQNKLILAGPTLDDSGGYIILFTSSEEEARELMSKDPSVSSGIMKTTFHPFHISLINCPKTEEI